MILSCILNDEVLVLGTPDLAIFEFRNEAEIRDFFSVMMSLADLEQQSIDTIGAGKDQGKLKDIFGSILGGDPRLHTMDTDDLLNSGVMSTPAIAMAIKIKKDLPNILSLFKCSAGKAKEWHTTGIKFVSTDATPPSKSPISKFMKKSSTEEVYASPKLKNMDLSLINSYPNADKIH